MAARIIDGKKMAEKILEDAKKEVASLKPAPCLAIVLAGDDPASLVWKQAGNRLVAARGVLVRAAGLDLTRYIPPKD